MESVSIVGTIRSNIGLSKGIELLLQGKSALDAVEESIKLVEDNIDDWTVGSGGLPNLIGDIELDASIMDGSTLKAGAVAGIKSFKNPISIARRIMEETPHVLIIGDGAEKFAKISGFSQKNLLTQNAKDLFNDFLIGKGVLEKEYDTSDSMKLKQIYYESFEKQVKDNKLMEWYEKYAKLNHGTVNIIAKDQYGNICSGVSTSGLSFKLPGRVGDSPIIGAGNYADNRFGAAACVGVGEIAIRLSLARIAVYEMSKGMTIEEAAINAIKTIINLEKDVGSLAILVMDRNGKTVSAANFKDYYFWIADSNNPKPIKKECIFVDTSHKEVGVGYHR